VSRRAGAAPLGLLAACVALAAVALVRAPVPASSGPPVAPTRGENAPHTHVAMSGMTGAAVPVGGTTSAAGGYAFVPAGTTLAAGVARTFTFHIQGPDGRPLTRFAVVHDRPLHLIVVRDDLSGFQHLHPTMAADGTWSIRLTLARPGQYRAYADFVALDAKGAQTAVVLGTDLTVPGSARVQALPPPGTIDDPDGYTVSSEGRLIVGTVEPLLFRVTRAGTPAALQPYLGGYGHLVMLRQRDLGYLHIHPEPRLVDGAVKFWVAAPGPGTYRMYLDFQVAGRVHTAQFTVVVP
jgi:hypothetical protein